MLGFIVLAGRKNQGILREVSDVGWEALIPFSGRPMVWYVLQAIGQVQEGNPLVVVGPSFALYGNPPCRNCTFLEPKESLLENIEAGLEALPGVDEVVVATSDIPLIQGEDIAEFIRRCRELGVDVCYPIVRQEHCEALLTTPRTYVRLREGRFSGGNLFYFRREALRRVWPFLSHVYRLRKKPLKLAPLFGWSLIFKALLGTLRIRDVEKKAYRLTGLNARAIPTERAAIAVDVDKPEDYYAAERWLSNSGRFPLEYPTLRRYQLIRGDKP
ncbi:MAG: nucleotidyltransferase family protein [Bacillota bacterium]|nr:nucleotidyltransferase family protein [Bacillota bacterium]